MVLDGSREPAPNRCGSPVCQALGFCFSVALAVEYADGALERASSVPVALRPTHLRPQVDEQKVARPPHLLGLHCLASSPHSRHLMVSFSSRWNRPRSHAQARSATQGQHGSDAL